VQIYVFLTNKRLTTQEKDDIIGESKNIAPNLTTLVWDGTELTAFLNTRPELLEVFFGVPRIHRHSSLEVAWLYDQMRDVQERMKVGAAPAMLEMMRQHHQNLLNHLKLAIRDYETTGCFIELQEENDVLCLDTSLELASYDYWETFPAFNSLLRDAIATIGLGKVRPTVYKTLVTVRSMRDLRATETRGPLVRLAGCFARMGCPLGFVEGDLSRRRGLFRDFSLLGNYGVVQYEMPDWYGTNTSRAPSLLREMRELWMAAASCDEVQWIMSEQDIGLLTGC
jgi:hypothetical protein